MKKTHKKTIKNRCILFGILIGMLIPLFVNCILCKKIPFKTAGSNGEWLAFWGSYLGAIFGGITAYVVAKTQIKVGKENNKKIKQQTELMALIKLKEKLDIVKEHLEFLNKELEKGKFKYKEFTGNVKDNQYLIVFYYGRALNDTYEDIILLIDKLTDLELIIELRERINCYIYLEKVVSIDTTRYHHQLQILNKKCEIAKGDILLLENMPFENKNQQIEKEKLKIIQFKNTIKDIEKEMYIIDNKKIVRLKYYKEINEYQKIITLQEKINEKINSLKENMK